MATLQERPFSRNYSGLITQSVLAGCIITICVTAHELMKRKRRGNKREKPLGSVESWEFGYLYQGRSWAKNPSPPHPQQWPLAWVPEVIMFPESKLCELRGVDATLYSRFMRGCFWFTLLHTFTTTVILLPIHIKFSDPNVAPKSMDRALISSLTQTQEGLRLLWIHLTLLAWVSVSWIYTLIWISKGVFRCRAQSIAASAERTRREIDSTSPGGQHDPPSHPHPQHPFHSMPPSEEMSTNRGLRLRTVMVTNIPSRLRSEKELKEYFEYHLSRPLAKPAIGLTSNRHPGFINKMISYLFNRIRRLEYFKHSEDNSSTPSIIESAPTVEGDAEMPVKPEVERVVLARKMTELASLLDRREEMLKRTEMAHIKLAVKTLEAVRTLMDIKEYGPSRMSRVAHKLLSVSPTRQRVEGKLSVETDMEPTLGTDEDETPAEDRTDMLIRTLGPFVERYGMRERGSWWSRLGAKLHLGAPPMAEIPTPRALEKQTMTLERMNVESGPGDSPEQTIWEALFSLPRSVLDPYQPLIHLSALFRGRTVPSIDYYTAKVGLLTSLITENRSHPVSDFEPVSTAFVTFVHPDHARRACKYLAVHPDNPLACMVEMAPEYEDIDWVRLMKQTFKAELLKDWVVDIGVWGFIIIWVIPVSALVGLVNITTIASVIPGLQNFFNHHELAQELITSLLPTVLTSLLMLTIPLILLLIAKKAHTIITLSALHDKIMVRYHKFLVSNVLVFFCVGVVALESFFTSFKQSSLTVLQVVGGSFPSAGPFYVGWIIFTMAIHGGIELILFGLPLFTYPSTKRATVPRRRAIGIRPRTFNYYYWLPNHLLIVFVILVFSVLNPLLMPFALVYFTFESAVIRNQLLHVYAKNYEANGSLLLIRLGRYSLDGLILAQVVFLGFLAVVKKEVHVGLTAVMIAATILSKILFTRIVRKKFEAADIVEAYVVCGIEPPAHEKTDKRESRQSTGLQIADKLLTEGTAANFKTWKLPKGLKFTYSAVPERTQSPDEHKPIPFDEFKRMKSWTGTALGPYGNATVTRPAGSEPDLSLDHTGIHNGAQTLAMPVTKPSLVIPHEKHPAWDDNSRLDRPYDNPYYSRPIYNHLWLPRNPMGILDLDDTVDVFRALTSDPTHGQLGEWVEGGIAIADLPTFNSSSDLSERMTLSLPIRRQLTGDEEISLPPDITDRIEHPRKGDYFEVAEEGRPSSLRRPSILTRHTSSFSSKRTPSLPLSHLGGAPEAAGPSRMRTSSFMSFHSYAAQSSKLSQAEQQPKRRSSYFDPASKPDLHAQAPFARSRITVAGPLVSSPLSMPSLLPGNQSSLRMGDRTSLVSGPISTREVVVSEVIAEEQNATDDRVRKEELAASAPVSRSWFTSWMFSRMPWTS